MIPDLDIAGEDSVRLRAKVSLRPGASAMLGPGHRAVRLSRQASEHRAALPVAAICLLGRDGGDVADQQRLEPLGGGRCSLQSSPTPFASASAITSASA